jgi:hypothetical protein
MSSNDELANQQAVRTTSNSDLKRKEILKKLTLTIPQLSVLIIIIGIIKQIIYYNAYHVPIKYFLGLSELGVIISDDLIYVIIIVTISSVIGLFFTRFYSGFDKKRDGKIFDEIANKIKLEGKSKEEIHTEIVSEYSKKSSKVYRIPNLIFKILSIASFIVIMFMIFQTNLYYKRLDYSTLLIFSSELIIISFISFATLYKLFGKSLAIVIVIALSFNLFTTLLTRISNEIESVENGRYTGTIITTKDEKSDTSNATHYFIGKTEKFVFIYNKKDSTTAIIPTDDIKKIILKEK